MAWSDKPTDHQVGTLCAEYEALLYEAADEAKKIGATIQSDLINNSIKDGVARRAVALFINRAEISRAIHDFSRPNRMIDQGWKMIVNFLLDMGVDVEAYL